MTAYERHKIRLQGPWSLIPITEGKKGHPIRGKIGTTWNNFLSDHRGIVRYERHFHKPTGCERTSVYLKLTDATGVVSAWLNDVPLASQTRNFPCQWDVTAHLTPRNMLAIEVEHTLDCGGLTGDVQLEIDID